MGFSCNEAGLASLLSSAKLRDSLDGGALGTRIASSASFALRALLLRDEGFRSSIIDVSFIGLVQMIWICSGVAR